MHASPRLSLAEAGMGGYEASNKKTHAVLMSAWETERNALKNVLSDSEIQRVSPAVKEFLPELHAFIDSKRSGDDPKCPKSILGLGQFLRYYLIRCSPEEFDSAVQAVPFPLSPHLQHLLDDLLSLFPRFSACSLLHYHLSQLLRKVLKQDAKQRALLFSTGFLSFVEQHVDDVAPLLGIPRRLSRTAGRFAASFAASPRPKPACFASSARCSTPTGCSRKCSAEARQCPP